MFGFAWTILSNGIFIYFLLKQYKKTTILVCQNWKLIHDIWSLNRWLWVYMIIKSFKKILCFKKTRCCGKTVRPWENVFRVQNETFIKLLPKCTDTKHFTVVQITFINGFKKVCIWPRSTRINLIGLSILSHMKINLHNLYSKMLLMPSWPLIKK